ncbi:hypothetical protein H9Q16_07265 [Sulfitobacter sp. TSTF-M16]|uniref:Uncharacterized protein n=1 Tax=Sulfitobacter aestuariivivens TaxID=2766981 RepID=A0A927HEB5_9RHOB|nr:hypothetical protein [Sulfitobacter aestuariivivens]MBD3663716.1 hypothetical protein [Sulfitobacter aestuariivivens]
MRALSKTQADIWHWFDRRRSNLPRHHQQGEYQLAKLTKTSVFKTQYPKAETPLDKTTRIVRKMAEEEAEQRQAKNDRLRNARLEREANTPRKRSR